MDRYGVRDVEKLLHLPRSTLRALIAAGFVSPERGARNAWRFTFQDLIVLRTAQALAQANVPQRRITRSVKELRRHLPDSMPLSGLSISAVADKVVVREGASRWQAESGQYLLEFEGDPANGSLSVIERSAEARPVPASLAARPQTDAAPVSGPSRTQNDVPPAPITVRAQRDASPAASAVRSRRDAHGWFDRALSLEKDDAEAAAAAYERALATDPALLDARVNLGRLLHENGKLARAEEVYREALVASGGDAVILFNFGVLLEDMKRPAEAIEAYEAALALDPRFADGHYNLALLCEATGRRKEAIRHMARYRALSVNGVK